MLSYDGYFKLDSFTMLASLVTVHLDFTSIPLFFPTFLYSFQTFFIHCSHAVFALSIHPSIYSFFFFFRCLLQTFDKCFLGSSETADANRMFCGQMGAVFLFGEALSAAQILAIYQLGPGYKVHNTSLIHAWRPWRIMDALYSALIHSLKLICALDRLDVLWVLFTHSLINSCIYL